MLKHIEPRQHPDVIELFNKLASAEPPGGALPDAVFNSLIQHEEYAVFVEVFDACHHVLTALRKKWFGITAPAPRCLKLELPPDWRSLQGAELLDALRQARVESLVVSVAKSGELVPDAVCDGIVEMLRSGLHELQVFSPLASPLKVAQALPHSELRRLSFMAPTGIASDTTAWRSYEILLAGTKGAEQLRVLDFQFSPSEYLALSPVLWDSLTDGLRGLTRIGVSTSFVTGDGLAHRNEAMRTFVGTLLRQKSPMTVDLRDCLVDVETLQELKAMLSTNLALEVLLPAGEEGHPVRTTSDTGTSVSTTTTTIHPVVITGTATDTAAPTTTTTTTVSLGAQALLVAPRSPQDVFDGWTTKFRHTAFDRDQNTLNLLTVLARSELPGESPASAAQNIDTDAAFCDLIEREEYAVFVDVFEACQQLRLLRHRQQGGGEHPPLRSLHFQMRSGWSYRLESELQDTLQRARIQSLTVQAWEDNGVVSAAVCDCIGEMLRAGLVELEIFDPVAAPDKLARSIRTSGLGALALSASPQLLPIAVVHGMNTRGLAVLPPSSNDAPWSDSARDAAWGSYATLVAGLAGCKTLHTLHLGFSPTQLYLLMSPLFAALRPRDRSRPGLPALALVRVSTRSLTLETYANHAKLFMQVMAECKTLQVFELSAEKIEAEESEDEKKEAEESAAKDVPVAFVGPLTGHPSLREFRVRNLTGSGFKKMPISVLPYLASLADSCPSFTHAQWVGPLDTEAAGLALKNFLAKRGDLDRRASSNDVAQVLRSSTCRVRTLVLHGHALTPCELRGIIDSLAFNTSVELLDLSRCLLELRTLLGLPRALQTNVTLKKIVLPDDWRYYYGASKDGKSFARIRPGPVRAADATAVFALSGDPGKPNAWSDSVRVFFEHYENGFVNVPRAVKRPGTEHVGDADSGSGSESESDSVDDTKADSA